MNIKEIKGREMSKWGKTRSPHIISFRESDSEGWWIDVVEYFAKSGEITLKERIIRRDVPAREIWYTANGWKKI